MENKIPVEVSARHVHVSRQDLQKLFGEGYELRKERQLTQPSDFACQETIDLKVGDKVLKNVRIIGPTRPVTQIEISKTDAVYLGVNPPIKISGDIQGSLPVILIGPNGEVELKEGLIIAKRHIHCSPAQAKEHGLQDGQEVSVKIEGERPLVFEKVAVRVKDGYEFCMHIDTDEGNACAINKIGQGVII